MTHTLAHELAVGPPPQPVESIEVARYYLSSEFSRLTADDPDANNALEQGIGGLDDADAFRLLEGMSHTYRLNGIYRLLADQHYDWYRVQLPTEAVLMAWMNPSVDQITTSPEIGMDPVKFGAYLDAYFATHVDAQDDPQGLSEFRQRQQTPPYTTLITRQSKSGIRVMDGNHRLIHAARAGDEVVDTYTGIPTDRQHTLTVGESTIRTLGQLIQIHSDDPEAIRALTDVARLLASDTLDAKRHIPLFWSMTPELRAAAKQALDQ